MVVTQVVLALTLLPRFGGHAEAGHELGIDEQLRGTIEIGFDAWAFAEKTWYLSLKADVGIFVRENRPRDGVVRISPQQIHFPAAAHLSFPTVGERAWGFFASHQSNHDVDEDDPVGNRETHAFEVYGAEWFSPSWRLAGGLYWDRGTTRALKRQNYPFDYYLGGVQASRSYVLGDPWYVSGALELIAHRNADHAPAYLNISAETDLGARWLGEAAGWMVFLRGQRLEDYQFQGDEPHYLVLLGTRVDTNPP